jgi:hypothetical protein
MVDESVEQQMPDASTVVFVDHCDRHLGPGGVGIGRDVSGDADAEALGLLVDVGHPRHVFGDDGHVTRLVDVEQAIEKESGQKRHASEETGDPRLRRKTSEPGRQCIAVVRCAEPQSKRSAIVEFDADG